MASDPRAALTNLVGALERHLEAAAGRRGEHDPVVLAAYNAVIDAFEQYDDALLDAYDEVTPLEVYHADDDEDLDDDDLDDDDEGDDLDDDELDDPDDDGGAYTGLDDEDYDSDEGARPSSPQR